ncbi:hypothetical protein SLS64_013664 [Diaporthe eres]|uniref:Cytochrome P450 n=1 Tax=Diaporthe eres TaxID=83184 RepID=A0ABR1NWI4_DIAER
MKGFPEETFGILHKVYDTKLLRIGPNELHISDPEVYKDIYKQVDAFPKYEPFYFSFNAPYTLFSETDAAKHKERRRLLNPMFSRAGILKLEPLIREKLSNLDAKVKRLSSRQDINVYDAFRLLTTEIIMEFAFSRSAGIIEEHHDDFDSVFTDALAIAPKGVYIMYEKPWLRHLANAIPTGILRFLKPEMSGIMDLLEYAFESVRYWESNPHEKKSHDIVFDRLGSLTQSDKITEGVDLLVAGSATTAASASTAVLQILQHPDVEKKLVDSLDAAIPSADHMPSLLELEKIDYLTIVSMSAHTVHTNVGVWGPDARYFNPDRWLGPEAKKLEQYQVAFSKGNRMCIGQNLATAEIHNILAHFFRKYKMSLPEDFVPPRKVDMFTLEHERPGIPIKVSTRQ